MTQYPASAANKLLTQVNNTVELEPLKQRVLQQTEKKMKLRNKLFGDMPNYEIIEEIVGGLCFLALIGALIVLYITA